MLELTNFPKGIVSALGLQSQGKTFREISETLAGVFESRDLFLLNSRVVSFPTAANAAVGAVTFTDAAGNPAVVPPGELWYLWHYTVACSPGAGAAARFAPAAQLDGLLITMPLGDYQSVAANENVRAFARDPIWMGPGSTLGAVVQSQTLAPSLVPAAVITRLRV